MRYGGASGGTAFRPLWPQIRDVPCGGYVSGLRHRHRSSQRHLDVYRVPVHRRCGHRHRLDFNADVYRRDHPRSYPRTDGGGEPNRHRGRHRGDFYCELFHRPLEGRPSLRSRAGMADRKRLALDVCQRHRTVRAVRAAAVPDPREPALAAGKEAGGGIPQDTHQGGGAGFCGAGVSQHQGEPGAGARHLGRAFLRPAARAPADRHCAGHPAAGHRHQCVSCISEPRFSRA